MLTMTLVTLDATTVAGMDKHAWINLDCFSATASVSIIQLN